MEDLALVPIEELFEELFNRTESCAIVYAQYMDGEAIVDCAWSCEDNLKRVGLAEYLKYKAMEEVIETEGEQDG